MNNLKKNIIKKCISVWICYCMQSLYAVCCQCLQVSWRSCLLVSWCHTTPTSTCLQSPRSPSNKHSELSHSSQVGLTYTGQFVKSISTVILFYNSWSIYIGVKYFSWQKHACLRTKVWPYSVSSTMLNLHSSFGVS